MDREHVAFPGGRQGNKPFRILRKGGNRVDGVGQGILEQGIQIYSAERFVVGNSDIPQAIRVSLISEHNPEAYKEALNLITTFKLKEFLLIGIFYDKPGEVPEDKLRSSIGIFRRNVGFPDPVPKEFEEYCKNNDYYSAELPMTSCLYSSWDYSNFFTMMVGISKFGKILKQSLEDVLFKKTFKIKENPKIIIELYVSESKMEFWVPTVNENKFFIYKKEEKPKSE